MSSSRKSIFGAGILVLVIGAGFLTGCSDDDNGPTTTSTTIKVLSEGTLKAGDPIPLPDGGAVLTVDGSIENTNDGDAAAFDMQTLESIGVVEYTAKDTAGGGGADVVFSGVLLSDLLDVVGASSDATTLKTVALNDYTIDIPISDIKKMPVLLATEADGKPMSIEDFGPTRVVYPNKQFDLQPELNDALWIWQLATITVK